MIRVYALTRDTVLCSWVRHQTLALPFSTQVNKSHPGWVTILYVASSCYRNEEKPGPDVPHGLYADLTFTLPLLLMFALRDSRRGMAGVQRARHQRPGPQSEFGARPRG